MSVDVDQPAMASSSCKSEMQAIEALAEKGELEIELLYYSTNGSNGQSSSAAAQYQYKQLRGKVYRCRKSKEYLYFTDHLDRVFKPGDYIYVETPRCDQPYYVAGLQSFKMNKRGDQLNVVLNWFYRRCELPETVYHTLVQDRRSEENFAPFFKDPLIQSREVFVSDAVHCFPVSAIRGKCVVQHYKDLVASSRNGNSGVDGVCGANKLLIDDDTFFYILGYNADSKTLANIQGEIRVGSSYQARLPDLKTTPVEDEYAQRTCETLLWSTDNRMAESDLLMYLSASRSMAAMTGVCVEGSTDEGCLAASRDQTTINALNALHENNYDAGRSLQELIKNPSTPSIDKKWSDDETKKFVRGLKQFGKNFFKIRKEFLAHKTTSELIEFYYIWKKTDAANNQRPRQRQRRPATNILRRPKAATTKHSRPTSSEFLDLESASENEGDSDESEVKDLSSYACHHCYTTESKDWHHGGKDKILLCMDCRIFYKKYGEMRRLDGRRSPPAFLFKFTKEADENGNKNRRNGKDSGSNVDEDSKSPSSASTSSNGSSDRKQKRNPKKNKKRKMDRTQAETVDDDNESAIPCKHKPKDSVEPSTSVNELSASTENLIPSLLNIEKIKLENVEAPSNKSVCETNLDEVGQHSNALQRQTLLVSQSENIQCASTSLSVCTSTAFIKRDLNFSPSQCNDYEHGPPPLVPCSSSLAETELIRGEHVAGTSRVKTELNDECVFVQEQNGVNFGVVVKEPEPKIDDSEHYRSKNAIFRRHWYRGEGNSCSRTDLVFIPLPDSALARKREAALKYAENRDEIKKVEVITTSKPIANVPPLASPQQPVNKLSTPAPAPTPANVKDQLPALQQLKRYAALSASQQGLPPIPQTPFFPHPSAEAIQNGILSGAFGTFEKERLEFEIREHQKKQMQTPFIQQRFGGPQSSQYPFLPFGHNVGLSENMLPQATNVVDPRQWFAMQAGSPPFGPPSQSSNNVPSLIPGLNNNLDPAVAEILFSHLSAQRVHLERLLASNPNPLVRLELEKVTAQLAAVAGAQHHTHSHTHSHTHLHIHPTTGVPMLTEDLPPALRPNSAHWPPSPSMIGQQQDILMQQYAQMVRNSGGEHANVLGTAGFPGFPAHLMNFGGGPQIGLEHLAAERLQQLQQQEFQRRLMERDHLMAAQHQSLLHQSDMMRRLHDEGNFMAGAPSSSANSNNH